MSLNLKFYKENNQKELSENDKKIFEIVEKNMDIEKFLKNDSCTNSYLTLSGVKQNLINWCDFDKNSSILEIGANFGELTEYFINNINKVVTIEENLKKAEYIQSKFSNVLNLEVIVGEFENVEFSEKFDYIVISNYLETHLIDKILEKAKKLLTENGKIFIAVDNQYGIKNWNGKDNYESLIRKNSKESYANISKDELEKIIKKVEFKNFKFYYIFPEYKAPNIIFTDEYNIDSEDITRNFELNELGQTVNFRENDILNQILETSKKDIKLFANSFLVEISNASGLSDVRYVSFTNYRVKDKQIQTIIRKNKVQKRAINNDSKVHIQKMSDNFKYFPKENCKLLDKISNDGKSIESNFINGKKLDKIISESDNIKKEFDSYKDFLYINTVELSKINKNDLIEPLKEVSENILMKFHYIENAFIDMVPKNCFIVEGEKCFFDQEWMIKNIPAEFILYRAIKNTLNINFEKTIKLYNLTEFVELFEKLEENLMNQIIDKHILIDIFNKRILNRDEIILKLQNILDSNKIEINNYKEEIIAKDNHISNLENTVKSKNNEIQEKNNVLERNEEEIQEKKLVIEILNQNVNDKEVHIGNLNGIIQNKDLQLVNYENKLQVISNSLSWKLTKPLRVLSRIFNPWNNLTLLDRILPPGGKRRIEYDRKQTEKKYQKRVYNYFKLTDEETAKYWKGIDHRLHLKAEKDNEKVQKNELTDYEKWMRLNEPSEEELELQRKVKFKKKPKISIAVPLYNTNTDFFRELLYYLHCQTYSNWELCLADGSPEKLVEIEKMCSKDKRIKYKFLNDNQGISGNTNAAFEMATGDYISLLDHDDLLSLNALYEVVKVINEQPDVEFIYSDEDKFQEIDEPRYEPHFKPDFAPDTLRANNYICHYSVFKKELLDKIGGERAEYDGAQDFDIILRATENAKKIVHISKILYYWRVHKASTAMSLEAKPYALEAGRKAVDAHLKRIGLQGNTIMGYYPGTYEVIYDVIGNPKVSILIPNKDGIDILKICIDSVIEKTTYNNYEIVIIENNSEEKETFDYYDKLVQNPKIKVINYPEKGFNYSKIINFGVKNVNGDFIVQLNNDTKLITPEWLEKMIGYCQREDVGGVGVKLYYPDDTIQHAGIMVGVLQVAAHIFRGLYKDHHGYFGRQTLIQNMNAVTAACIMTKRSIYEEVGYMNEEFAVAFNDIDFCLRIREKGKLIVYNPFIEFTHYESKTRGNDLDSDKIERFKGEVNLFLTTWKEKLDKGDEYYNKNLTLDSDQYQIRTDKI